MAVETLIREFSYKPGAAKAPEAIRFAFLDPADLIVTHIAADTGTANVLSAGLHYVIAGNGRTASATIAATGTWPANDLFRVVRSTGLKQPAKIPPGQPLPSADIERELDRSALTAQERQADHDRLNAVALKLPDGEVAEPLPKASERAGGGKVLAPDPVTGGMKILPASMFGKGERGPNGYSAATLEQLKAAPVTDGPLMCAPDGQKASVYNYRNDRDYTGLWDNENYIASDSGGTGAWVKQGADSIRAGNGETVQESLDRKANPAGTRTALSTLPTTAPAILTEGVPAASGRFGTFIFRYADLSSLVTADPDQGICIAPSSDTTGASGAWVRVFDGEINAKWFGAVGTGAITNEDIAINAAIKAAIAYSSYSSVGMAVRIPAGSYKIVSTIDTTAGGTGQVALRGDGEFATRIFPQSDITAIKMASSYIRCGGFSVEFSPAAAASIASTRLAVVFASSSNQLAYAEVSHISTLYAYRGFTLPNYTGGTMGNTYLTTLRKLSSIASADYGFYFDSKNGSTTLRMEQCYAKCFDMVGSAYGKGYYFNNINDIMLEGCAVDGSIDSWIFAQNYNTFIVNGFAVESCKIVSSVATAMYFNGSSNKIDGLKFIGCTFDVKSGNARALFFAGNAQRNTVRGFSEQASTVGSGTTKYVIAFANAATWVYVPDESVPYTSILDNGFYSQLTYGGVRYSRTNNAPTAGANLQGAVVMNREPSAGGSPGWVCVTAGTPGTWKEMPNVAA
ncbi:hypothetical protein [Stakelama pacifica]|uniref:Pectate lyase-like protein n=1 Tax=Stakelama pacifica TaxID=517720 RepID=A0A4R6FNF8_9SPHN|nr:hypothetical protein [Stakelama pacifica]TDN82967.1 hypothetical protein EV664_105165 [Stakelama pacifica]